MDDTIAREIRAKSRAFVFRRRRNIVFGHLLVSVCAFFCVFFVSLPQGMGSLITHSFQLAEYHLMLQFNPKGLTQEDVLATAHARVAARKVEQTTHFVLPFALASLLISGGLHALFLRNQGRRQALLHRRGHTMSDVRAVNNETKGGLTHLQKERALVLGKERLMIPPVLESRHMAFIGASGTGKSNAIAQVLEAVLGRGDQCLVIDPGGVWFAHFGTQKDHILSLRDRRSAHWSFWCEDTDPRALADSLIEERTSQQSFFVKGPRAVLADLFRITTSTDELLAVLRGGAEGIRSALEKEDCLSAKIVGRSAGEQADGILGSLVLDLAFLSELNQWNTNGTPFSLSRWVSGEEGCGNVYLTFDQRETETVQPLLRAWTDVFIRAALSEHPGRGSRRPLWLFCDELRALGHLPGLPLALDQGRKYGLGVVAGFQTPAQIDDVYGRAANAIKQGFQTRFFFASGERGAREYASDCLSEEEHIEASISIGMGVRADSENASLSQRTASRRLVLPAEIDALADLHCFVKMGNRSPFRLSFDYRTWPEVMPRFVSEVPQKQEPLPTEPAFDFSRIGTGASAEESPE